MKFLPQKPLLLPQRPRPFSTGIEWQGKFRNAGSASLHFFQRIKGLGLTVTMDDYEKRKLGIFNQLNFFQLLTGIAIPISGLMRNQHFPVMAWEIACIPAVVSLLVLVLNARREYYLAQIAYFVGYPIATSFVYFWGFNMGVELSFILYGILSVFFIQDLSQMLFALALSMASYFGLAVVCKNYTFQLATGNLYFYFFNQLLALGFIFYGLFLIKKENTGYQYSILRQKEAIAKNEQQLKQQTEELLLLNSFKGRLFSIIAHDLKSPIYALRNLFRNMQQYDLPAEDIKGMVPEIVNELTYTTSLMENLLLWARSQMRADSVKPQPIDLAAMIEEVGRLLRLQADAKHIRLKVSGDNPVIAFADRDMVSLIVRNLLSNAIKYTPDNGNIKIAAQKKPTGVELFVQDSGLGIEPEALEKIKKNIFYSTKGTSGESGTGLGLMLCREFAVRNGGELLIESQPGKGSVFTVKLPASE
ncbi:MAG TPA: HAMP domain-containing sensor histidine kinase [Puia sp.]|jgi:signal transduction histidine kinase|nr:HAMP domain-containing sensor histidine kinase [Puia sp.]